MFYNKFESKHCCQQKVSDAWMRLNIKSNDHKQILKIQE